MSVFEQIGMEQLREVVTDFYDRVFRDVMIGFMFQGKDKAHLIARETEFAAKLLGAPNVTYQGRPMRAAHANHTIFGGHFERRLQILKDVLAAREIAAEVQQVWIDHTNALRSQITRDVGSECATTREATPRFPVPSEPVPAAPTLVRLGRRAPR